MLSESKTEERFRELVLANACRAEPFDWGFNLLVAATVANEISTEPTSLIGTAHQGKERRRGRGSHERVQNAVLDQLNDPAERQEYQRFRAFQWYIREYGAEEAMKQWLEQRQSEKERLAAQALLTL
ncbi:hypothetical protein BGZ65_001604 [Modicella reniformis]|uniref:Uncharacterized protein n=1 Tax=Modicella reniformis TaxID=1440133 RepID=A0A9P6J1U8_9FUNG|nr:hypothetical protein BGZ65_001604 [Modicella reniformis]